MTQYAQEMICAALRVLEDNQVPANKIKLHKFLFFVDYMGTKTGLTFEPYTYGPFSFTLANNLDFMILTGQVYFDGRYYTLAPGGQTQAEPLGILRRLFLQFQSVFTGFSFGTLECVATLIYCKMVLEKVGESTSDEAIKQEFKDWKGSKYKNEKIDTYLERLHRNNII
jgi:uncharacterized protein YwgA